MMAILRVFVCAFILMFSCAVVYCVPAEPSESLRNLSNHSCDEVKQLYVSQYGGSAADTSNLHNEGNESSSLCGNGWNGSCCTPAMERRYSEASMRDFQAMLQSSNAFLKNVLSSSAAKFRDNFLEMIQVSQNNTSVLFSEVYKKMDSVARAPVSRLYADLSAHVAGQSVELESRIASFFDLLFPLVYHHSINPKLKDFSDDYKECLRQTQQEIRPFGDIADKLTLHVTRAFSVARTLLEALQTGVEVISATDNLRHSRPECQQGLVRLVYCSQCRGYARVKPCSGYCLNVVRGCLAHVAELDQPWSDYVSSLERLTSGLVASYNIEEVLSALDTKISEAIMYAMENGPELSKKVKLACGHPRRARRDVSEPSSEIQTPNPGRIVPIRSTEDSLYVRLQQVVQKLTESKGQYANLADIVCSDESWAVREEGQCWNGHSLGQYTKTIAGVGVAAQRYNPEMKAPETEDLSVLALDEKLQRMSRHLRLSISPELPQSDSYMVEGSGSGTWTRNRIGDDEDYDKGSGSGDWGGTKPSDFNFDNGDARNRDINIKVKSGAVASSLHSTLLMGFLFLLVTMSSRVTLTSQ